METKKYVFWQEYDIWIGYLEEYPDYMTQGKTLGELKENLKDFYKELTKGIIPYVHKVARLMKRYALFLAIVLLLSSSPAMAGGWNHFISWSTDSNLIAYVMDGLPFVISPDGTSRQILPHAGSIAIVKISPDHSMVAMWGPEGYSLGMRGRAGPGTGDIQVATSDGKKWKSIGRGNNFSWSPDSKYLAIGGILVADAGRLWEDGYKLRELSPPAMGGWSVSWSPSGKKLAQSVTESPGSHSHLLQITEVASGNTKNIPLFSSALTVSWVDWLDEETLLVVATQVTTDKGESFPDSRLWKVDINGGVLSHIGGPVPFSRDGPHLSLDKKRFIACDGSSEDKTGIWIADVGEHMSLRNLPVGRFDGSVNLTCWSPVADKFAFMTGRTMYGPEQTLWLYSISDGKQTKIDAGVGGKDTSVLYNSQD